MQLIWTAEQKVLNQFVTMYQSIIKFNIDKIWAEVIIKFNKKDADDMLDDVNAHLIKVCEEYLKENSLPLDKYQLSNIVMRLYSQTVSQLDEPFKIILKENKALIQDYLEKNKKKLEALERIKKENDEYDKQYVQAKIENKKKANRVAVSSAEETEEYAEVNKVQPKLQPKQVKNKAVRWTDALAIDDFTLPMY